MQGRQPPRSAETHFSAQVREKNKKWGAALQRSNNINWISKSGQSLFMFYATRNSLYSMRTLYMSKSFSKNRKKYKEKIQLNGPQRTTFKWSIVDMSMLKWMESDTVHFSPLWKQILSLMCYSQKVRGALSLHRSTHSCDHLICSGSDSFLCTFCLSQKMLTNMSHHFCNMLHHSTACHTICHVSLHSVNIYLLKLDCSATTYFCRILRTRVLRWLSNPSSSCALTSWELLEMFIVWRQAAVDFRWLLPLNMVQVPWHAQSSDGVEFPVVHQAVVSAASHCHPGHQIPVVQQGHVAPYISHHHTRLCTTWDIEG